MQIRDGLAILMCKGEYEVSLLLEPAAPAPFDVIVDSLVPFLAPEPVKKEVDAEAHPEGPSHDDVRAELTALGFTEATFQDKQLRWRWRLVNIALCAGSGGGHRMTPSQLHYMRAELDFRMLHARHAAIVRHCLRALRGSAIAGQAVKADDGVAGAAVAEPSVSQKSEGSAVESESALAKQVRIVQCCHTAAHATQ